MVINGIPGSPLSLPLSVSLSLSASSSLLSLVAVRATDAVSGGCSARARPDQLPLSSLKGAGRRCLRPQMENRWLRYRCPAAAVLLLLLLAVTLPMVFASFRRRLSTNFVACCLSLSLSLFLSLSLLQYQL